jgi:hypothetical protein
MEWLSATDDGNGAGRDYRPKRYCIFSDEVVE